MTDQHLREQLLRIRTRVRQLLLLYGVSWLVAVLFGGALLAGLLDWLIHIDDPGVRLILALGVVGASGWVLWRLLISPLRRRLTEVEIALRIERRHPGLRDSLASTVQFLARPDDVRVGSPELQRQVIERTLRQVRGLRLDDVMEVRPVRRAALAAIAVCLTVAVVVGLNQADAATALHRLVFPFAERPWPKQTVLRLLDEDFQPVRRQASEPFRVARGDTLRLFVENARGKLPDDLRVQYRLDGEPGGDAAATADAESAENIIEEPVRRASFRDESERARDVGAIEVAATKGLIEFRAVGGDDAEMPWYRLEVVPPPRAEGLQVTVTPPAYTGEGPTVLPPGVGHVSGLLGTRVEIRARSNKPLDAARLRVKDQLGVPVEIGGEDSRDLHVAFTLTEPGVYSYWFELRDRQGFEDADAPRYELRGIADMVPEVWIDRPESDRTVTPTAVVRVAVGAKDDLGLGELRLRYRVNDAEEVATETLFAADAPTKQQEAEHTLELAPLGLSPGDRVTLWVEATDAYELNGERHVGRSVSRTLTVIPPEEKREELADRQAGLIDDLEQTRDSQEQSRANVEQLLIQLNTTGQLRPQDVDQLKRAELQQRQIASRLNHPVDGLDARIGDIRQETADNKIDDPAMADRLERIADEVTVLREDHLPEIERELLLARKAAEAVGAEEPPEPEANATPSEPQDAEPGDAEPGDAEPEDTQSKPADGVDPDDQRRISLERASGHQRAVIESLDGLLADLSEWRRRRDLNTEIGGLIRGQEDLNQERAELAQKHDLLSKTEPQLTAQERADLEKLAQKQTAQAGAVDRLDAELAEASEAVRPHNADLANMLEEARGHLRQSATAGTMRDAARAIRENALGEAEQQQARAVEQLRELDDILANRGAANTEELVLELRKLEEELEQLRKKQEELLQKAAEARQNPDDAAREQELERLRKEQQELSRQAADLARRMRRAQAGRPGASSRRAASRMEDAARQLTKDEPDAAQEQMQEALDDLKQAGRELAEERQEAEEQLAREMLERIAGEIESFIARQQGVIDETNRLEAERRERGRWTRAQLASLRNVAELQTTLRAETEALAEKIQAAEVFALALRGAAADMKAAADRLAERVTDLRTVELETAARHRFEDLVAALKAANQRPQGESEGEAPQDQQPEGPGPAGPQTDGIPHLAQLRMLKTLQEDLISRTTRLDRRRRQPTGELADDLRAELDRLVTEQGLLADLTRNLTRQFVDAFQADPAGEEDAPPDAKEAGGEADGRAGEPGSQPGEPAAKDELKDLGLDLDLDKLLPDEPEKKGPIE